MSTKRCTYCQKTKPIRQFVRDTNFPDGRRYHCKNKECHLCYLEDTYGWDRRWSWRLNPVEGLLWQLEVEALIYGDWDEVETH